MSNDAVRTRNFAVVGHNGGGKTSLCELMLFKSKAVDRLGAVAQKTSVSDYMPEEQEKQSSIYMTPLSCKWKDHSFFFLDTPGYGEFVGEMISGLNGAENALIVVDGTNGLEVGSTRAWKLSREKGLPRFIFINKLDGDRAHFQKTLEQLQEAFGKTVCVPLTMPIGTGAGLKGVAAVLEAENPPAEAAEEMKKYREQLMDAIAESNEELMMKYLDGQKLTEQETSAGLHKAIMAGSLVPVFAGSSAKDIGVEELMNHMTTLFAPPAASGKARLKDGSETSVSANGGDGVAVVFKTVADPFIGQLSYFHVLSGSFKSESEVHNVSKGSKERFGQILIMNGKTQTPAEKVSAGAVAAVAKLKGTGMDNTLSTSPGAKELATLPYPAPVMSYAVTAVKSGEEEKISAGLHKLAENDHTIKLHRHPETHETLLSGMGDQHLGNTVKKLKEINKVEVALASPKIPYRETITSQGEGHHRHKKQTGGHGQFAEVYLKISPNAAGYEFENAVVGGNIPKNFIPAVEKGVVEAMTRGPLAGCVVENIKVTVTDGKHHSVDSSEMAFKIAARMAFRDAMAKAKPVLLEPIMKAKIMIPDTYMGDITGDLNHKRGRILGMSAEEGMEVVNAEVPLAEMAKYATELRSMTHGRGSFDMEFSRHEIVPSMVANQIIANFKLEEKEEE